MAVAPPPTEAAPESSSGSGALSSGDVGAFAVESAATFATSDFSGSVNTAFSDVDPDGDRLVTASAIASGLKRLHPEYAGGRLAGVAIEPEIGEPASEAEWRRRVGELYDAAEMATVSQEVIDGRLMLLGLAELDHALRSALEPGGTLEALRSEVTVRPRSARPTLRMLADRPLESDDDDLLGFSEYADALAELIDNPETVTPLTIAISAPWGAGKTSLAKLICRRLDAWPQGRGEPPHITCWFNAWMHADAKHLGAAFAAEVAKTANRYRSPIRRVFSPLPSAMLSPRERFLRQARLMAAAAVVAALVFLLMPTVEVTDSVDVPGFGVVGGAFAIIWMLGNAIRMAFGAASAAAAWVDDPASAAATGSMGHVSDQIGRLIGDALRAQRAGGGAARFVIFVDDLERCAPPRSVEVCEVANQLLGHEDVVTVLVADMPAVAAASELEYAGLAGKYHARSGMPDGSDTGAFGRLFLQKIVQFQFDLPTPRHADTRRLTTDLAAGGPPPPRRPVPWWRRPRARAGRFAGRLQRPSWFQFWFAVASTLVTAALAVGAYFAYGTGAGIIGGSAAVAIAAAAVVSGSALRQRSRRQAQRRTLDTVAAQAARGGAGSDEIERRLIETAQKMGAKPDLARQTHRRYISTRSALRAQAEQVIAEFFPPLPRGAKRMLNRLGFLLVVAWERDMFGGRPSLDPAHLGKWIVLQERWPELAWLIADDPNLMAVLEKGGDAATEVLGRAGMTGASSSLERFMAHPPRLGGLADRLVHFVPADAATPQEDGRHA